MDTWLKIAKDLFLDEFILKDWYEDKKYYWLFFEILPKTHEAHQEKNTKFLEKAYGFAEWCLAQKDDLPDLMNAASVSFYEHLFDSDEELWPDILGWLSQETLYWATSYWSTRVSPQKLKKLNKIISSAGTWEPHQNIFQTGEIEAILKK